MNKITPDHVSRSAYVYVRQSTPDQLTNNPESRRRQYALAARARALGWQDVIVIDEDLGRSGGGISRPGFERLLAAICTGAAGAVFAVEASRLACNGRDWHIVGQGALSKLTGPQRPRFVQNWPSLGPDMAANSSATQPAQKYPPIINILLASVKMTAEHRLHHLGLLQLCDLTRAEAEFRKHLVRLLAELRRPRHHLAWGS